jgi:hypothetical protein
LSGELLVTFANGVLAFYVLVVLLLLFVVGLHWGSVFVVTVVKEGCADYGTGWPCELVWLFEFL